MAMLGNRNRAIGFVQALIASLTVSVAPTLVKVGVNANINPITLITLRLWIASVIFWVYFSITQPAILRIDRRFLLYASIAGVINCTGMIMYYMAMERLDASIATMIFSFYPIVTVLILSLKGERIHLNMLLCLAIALIGIFLLLNIRTSLNLVGILLVLGTTLGYAIYLNIMQWYMSDYPAPTSAIYLITIMAIFCTFVWLSGARDYSPISSAGWISIVGTAVIATALTRLASISAIRRLGSGLVSYFGPLETLLGIMGAVLFLGERLIPKQWIGGFLIMISMLMLLRFQGIKTNHNI